MSTATRTIAMTLTLAYLQGCSGEELEAPQPPAPLTNETGSDSSQPTAKRDDPDRPKPIGEATFVLNANQQALDVYGCSVHSIYPGQGQSDEAAVQIELDAVTPGTDLLTAPPSAAYDLDLKIEQRPSGLTSVLTIGASKDDSWSYQTMAISPAEIERLQTSTGQIKIDGETFSLVTGATAQLRPRPGIASIINPSTGQFEIAISTLIRPNLEAPQQPFQITITANCTIDWQSF